MNRLYSILLGLILIACTPNPKDYSIQITGDVIIDEEVCKLKSSIVTDSTLFEYYQGSDTLKSLSESVRLSTWFNNWFRNNIEQALDSINVTDYELKIRGLVRDPKSDEIYIIIKQYNSR